MNLNTRHIVVKTLLNADEFCELTRKCSQSDMSQSKALRDLIHSWIPRRHVMQERRPVERAMHGHNTALFPARRGGARIPLRV